MRLPTWSEEAQEYLTKAFPKFNFGFHYHKHDQIEAACPYQKTQECRENNGGTDRLIIFENGNIYCRRCEAKAVWRVEDKVEREKRQAIEKETREVLKKRIATCRDWQSYHNSVGKGATIWHQHGITNEAIDHWGLGWCEQAPCCDYPTASLTIPVFYNQTLVDIRHRLVTPQGKDKYRSHFPKLPPSFFNIDEARNAQDVFIVEGEKKAIVMSHNGLPSIAFPGLEFSSLLTHIIPKTLTTSQTLYVVPDPHSYDSLHYTVCSLRELGYTVKIIDLIEKPDELILEFGASIIKNALPYARWW